MKHTLLFILGGTLSLMIGILHLAIIFAGPDAYLYFGAGKEMADGDAAGSIMPDLITFIIAIVFMGFGMYAFSGAGKIKRLPALRIVLIIIASIYLLRGLGVIVDVIAYWNGTPDSFRNIIFSLVSLVTGLLYAIGIFNSRKEYR